ncbi:MAG: formate dehydrogenase accessory sulfurtransferase FdhD [Acidobacteriota bacterium]
MQRPVVAANVQRWKGAERSSSRDELAVEEPCEIRLEGESVAVLMRTPGHDRELAAGFLFTEGIVGPGDVGTIAHCADADSLHADNVVEVRMAPGHEPRRSWQRNFFASSSCGICGKASIESIQLDAPPVAAGPTVSQAVLSRLVDGLRGGQTVFSATGGLHAAAIFEAAGRMIVLREDVGRHNAVDKAVGHALLADRLPLDEHVLVVSGRTSFEIVQKALMARLPVVAGVSAASSLAVELAAKSNMTLVGFLRGEHMNVYSGQQRIRS